VPFRALFALALVLLAAGCAASDTASDKDRQRGFYGGVSVGGVP
jgi:hypothetical protein